MMCGVGENPTPCADLFNQLIHIIMTQKEFTDYMTTKGWSEKASTSVYFKSIIDKDLSVNEWKRTLVGAYASRNRTVSVLLHLADYLDKNIPQWEDLTLPNLSDFKDVLLLKVSRNAARTYLGSLSATMSIYSDYLPTKNFRAAFQLRKEPSQHVALTEEEVERIHNFKPRTSVERDIKRSFMIECLCGARASDVENLTPDNVKGNWLVYVSQKTKTETSVPVHRHLLEYLNTRPYRKNYQRAVVCKTIKRICCRCGINDEVKIFTKGKWITKQKWELVGSHTARRSFATQLALRGVPVPTIAKLMGHSDVKMTSRYICIDKKDIGDTAMAFFS